MFGASHSKQTIYLLLKQRQILSIELITPGLDICMSQPTLTMPVFSELLFIMSLKEVKRFLKDSMKSASPLFSYSLGGEEVED